MAYRIMLVGTSDDPVYASSPEGLWYEYETGAEAQEQAKALALTGDGRKWRVKRVVDTRWKSREENKFRDGTYEYLPWEGSSWWDACRSIHRHHFPHVSRSAPGMIAYTESEEKGMDNKQTQIKPGRYLEKYLSAEIKLFGVNIKRLVTEFERDYNPHPVFFASTEDDIQWVYETGPESCMSNAEHRSRHGWGWPSPGRWPLDTHACRTYANGDLQIAYLTQNDDPKGEVIARALVWPEKKTYSRCYGAESSLRKELEALGYFPSAPIGAKIQRKQVDVNGQKLFLTPYIDIGHQSGAGATAVKDRKTYLEIVIAEPGSHLANATSGLCGGRLDRNMRPQAHTIEHCQMCNVHYEEVDGLYQVFTSSAAGDFQMWCVDCIETEDEDDDDHALGAYVCGYDGRYYSKRYHPAVIMASGQMWSQRAFRGHGFKCAATKQNYHIDERIKMFDGANWCRDHFRVNGFTDYWTGDHYPREMAVHTGEGKVLATAVAHLHAFTCEGCSKVWLKASKQKPLGLCPRCNENEYRMANRLRGFTVPHMEEYHCD
jgi:hypothetical protein